VQAVKLPYRFLRLTYSNVQVAQLGFADSPPNRTCKSCEKRFRSTTKIQRMSIECDGRSGAPRGGDSSPNFEVLPVSTTSQFAEQSRDDTGIASAKEEGSARVSERQTNAPPSGQRAAYLQKRNQRRWFTVSGEEQGSRFVTVSFAQHFHPGGGVEEIGAGMRSDEPVPIRVARWINDVYLPGSRREPPANPSRGRAEPLRDRRNSVGFHAGKLGWESKVKS
jgi:hypothetical protein